MKAIRIALLPLALLVMGGVYAHDYQISMNGIGDWNLITVGGYTFAKPISVDLSPTNAPMAGVRYSVRCQVIYRDNSIPRPMTEMDLALVRNTGAYLNEWLSAFMTEEYAGDSFDEVLRQYSSGEITDDLNLRFPAYVAGRIAEMSSDARPNVDTVTVSVEAEGTFKAALVHRLTERED